MIFRSRIFIIRNIVRTFVDMAQARSAAAQYLQLLPRKPYNKMSSSEGEGLLHAHWSCRRSSQA